MTELVQYLIPSEPVDGHGFGRSLVNHDPRSRAFPARALAGDVVRQKSWGRVGIYDQGSAPHCVAYAGKGAFNTATLRARFPYRRRSAFDTSTWYSGAQSNDEWPGEAYDGTSALGLCRYLQGQGLVSEYRWAFGLQDVLLTLSHVGPVLLGVYWKSGMLNTDGDGFIHAAGSDVGGHEVELVGVRPSTGTRQGHVIGANSWGKAWGAKGRFKLSFDDLGTLLDQDGDAVVVLK